MAAPTPQDKAKAKKDAATTTEWLSEQKALVADSNRGSRTGLAKTLSDLGVKTSNLLLAENLTVASEHIAKSKPGLIITDFDFGKGAGLTLLQEQRAANPDAKKSLFVIVTGNTSQSAVAQAAEEDVDTFILKPYTLDGFRKCLTQAIIAKITPSEYMVQIEAGKSLMFAGKHDEAIAIFEKAKGMDPKPSLAHFYAGQAQLLKKLLDGAETDYKKGLTFNKIHYKCMVGLFDALMDRKSHAEAYDIMKKMSLYFPANPKRLATIIRLAVMNQKVEDMEKYHLVFTTLETRSPELVNYICAGLVVCGKYYLKTGSLSRALELFQKAAVSSAGASKFLREIIFALASNKSFTDAEGFLKRFTPEARGSADHQASEFVILAKTAMPDTTVNRGRAILRAGLSDPSVYELLVEASIKAGVQDYAEQLIGEAKQKWPKMAARFDEILKVTERPEKTKDAAEKPAKANAA